MIEIDLNQLLHVAISTSLEAGIKIMEIYDGDDFEIQNKSDNSPLTKADLAANEIICRALEKTNIPVLSEEGKHESFSKRKDWQYLWIVDPIDGTKEFIKKNGEFTVNIALIKNGIPILGVIYTPTQKIIHYATIERGSFKAFISTKQINLKSFINNSQKLPISQSRNNFIIAVSRSHPSKETEIFIEEQVQKHSSVELLAMGSSLKLCLVAEGKADLYPRFAPTMEWDTAAGHAICLYAGKDVIDFNTNKSMLYNRENLVNNSFIVQ